MKTRAKSLVLAAVLALPSGGAVEVSESAARVGLGSLAYTERLVEGRRLLAYDPRGDGRIVEVLGDLDNARYVAVVVPGAGHGLANYLADPSVAAPRRNGLALLAELRRQAPGEGTAVVVWTGYDAPERIDLAAVRSDRAIVGAPDLARLTRMLPDAARTTLVCHSYGSVVCGHAASEADVDGIVLLGSPGVDVDRAQELETGARLWAARAADDPIRLVPDIRLAGLGHGPDPTGEGFGAEVFATGEIHGHDHYYDAGSQSLANIARIVLEQESEVTRA